MTMYDVDEHYGLGFTRHGVCGRRKPKIQRRRPYPDQFDQIIDATVRAVIPQTERLLLFTSLVASAIFDCTLGI
jgi:hypothetical protein